MELARGTSWVTPQEISADRAHRLEGWARSMLNPMSGHRRMEWPALRNARDLGGLPLIGGGQTRTGVVIRSDTLARLTSIGLDRALDHPVRTVIDLRETRLAAAQPNPLREHAAVTYHHLPLLPDEFPLPVIRGGYPQALDAAQPQMASVLRALLVGERPALVHCHSGVGRTGLFTIALLDLVGVPADAIMEDFRASLTEAHHEEQRVRPRFCNTSTIATAAPRPT